MRLENALYQLPLRLDVADLRRQVAALPDDVWIGHRSGFPGNSAAILISPDGRSTNARATAGPLAPTPAFHLCPALPAVVGRLQAPVSCARLMRLAPGAVVPRHFDSHFGWHRRCRVHIPLETDSGARMRCREAEVHMAAGEAWTLSTADYHSVHNRSSHQRIHLVVDTAGSARFWQMVAASRTPDDGWADDEAWRTRCAAHSGQEPMPLAIEPYAADHLSADEMDRLIEDLVDGLVDGLGDGLGDGAAACADKLRGFAQSWRAAIEDAVAGPASARAVFPLVRLFAARFPETVVDTRTARARYAREVIASQFDGADPKRLFAGRAA